MLRVVPAAHAKPHAQQQIARDLEVDYENFLTNVRGPPDKFCLLTLGRPCVRCYSTPRAWSPVCGSTFRNCRPQAAPLVQQYSYVAFASCEKIKEEIKKS